MDAGAVNTAGGICELAGLGLAVREYLAALEHQGQLAALRRRLQDMWRTIEALWRRLLGRPGRNVVVHAGAAVASVQAMAATVRVTPAGFSPGEGQSVEDQVVELGRVVNRLRDWIQEEQQLRDRTIEAARADARAELHAEAQRLRDLISEVDGKLQDFDQRTTGDLRLRLDGLLLLFVGIVFTTWAPDVADHALGWLPWPFFYLALIGYVVWRLVGSTTRALRSS